MICNTSNPNPDTDMLLISIELKVTGISFTIFLYQVHIIRFITRKILVFILAGTAFRYDKQIT